jgi:hypothetical protein
MARYDCDPDYAIELAKKGEPFDDGSKYDFDEFQSNPEHIVNLL